MNIAQVNRAAVRDHDCPAPPEGCGQPAGKRCIERDGWTGRPTMLNRPHNARAELVDAGGAGER